MDEPAMASGMPAPALDMPLPPSCPPPDFPPCLYRVWSAGRRSCGDNIPPLAQGECFPGDEPGAYCERTGEPCDPHPAFCPLWTPSDIVCPSCLAFKVRRYPVSEFTAARLLARTGEKSPRDPRPGLHCPNCDEEYADTPALALFTINRLRDVLDDLNFAEGSLEELRAEARERETSAAGPQ